MNPVTDPTTANIAIAAALGFDAHQILEGGLHLTLDRRLGPIVEVEMFLTNNEGKRYILDDEVATELKRYKLVPIEDDE